MADPWVRKSDFFRPSASPTKQAKPFFEIFSHARVYVRGDDENNIFERSENIY